MKIYAESQGVRQVPYVHLGYAAALVNHLGPSVFWGVVLALVATLMAIKPPQAWRAKVAVRLALIVVALAAVQVTLFGVERAKANRDRVTARIGTGSRIYALGEFIEARGEREPLPADLSALIAAHPELLQPRQTPQAAALDGWGREMKLTTSLSADGRPQHTIRSAGHDAVFDTADDVVERFEGKGETLTLPR